MTQGNQTYSVLTRPVHDLWGLIPWYMVIGVAVVCVGQFVLRAWELQDAERNALTYEDGLALANKRLRPLPKEGREWVEAMAEIAYRESRNNHLAQNPDSTAFGLYQFLDMTWERYGGKTIDPQQQTRAALAYMVDRHGSPVGALDYWKRNGHY